jgi:predicted phage terminase large subunit-like protein
MVSNKHRYRRSPTWEAHQPFTIVFNNGAKVLCKGLKDPDSARGSNINWLWYDEAGRDKTGESWLIAIASVRIGKDPQAWITTTPKGKKHWIYEFFVKQNLPQAAIDLYATTGGGRKLIEFFFTTLEENQDNLDPGFVASLLAAYSDGYLREQEIHGKFVEEGGRLGDRKWFSEKFIDAPPENIRSKCRFWDLAATERKMMGKRSNDPDATVGTRMSWDGESFYIEHQLAGWWEWADIKEQIKQTAISDGWGTKIFIEQEPASGGKNQVAELKQFIQDRVGTAWQVEGYRPEGDRVQGANVWFAEAQQGKFYIVRGSWNEQFLDELDAFPDSDVHDDRITSVTGARFNLAPIRTWKNIDFLHL